SGDEGGIMGRRVRVLGVVPPGVSCYPGIGSTGYGPINMHEPSFSFLKELLETPSPSGFERPIQDVVRNWVRPYADEIRTDRHGNVIALRNPGGQPRIMLAGHCDQIGLMVQHIDDNGFLYVQPIGGWDMQILLRPNPPLLTH